MTGATARQIGAGFGAGSRLLARGAALGGVLALAGCLGAGSGPDPTAAALQPMAASAAPQPMTASDAARVICGAAAGRSGRATASMAGFRLHDPAPDTVTLRTVRITGFADRCARDVTGAVVLFGQPDLYELTRAAQEDFEPGPTDHAYDALKARLCGGAVPCAALQRRAVFVTAHGRAGDDRRWLQLLLADHDLLASEVKTR